MKYDLQMNEPDGSGVSELFRLLGISPESKIITCGSTWPGEEEILLDAFKEVKYRHTSARLVLVPRHVERSGEIETLIKSRGFECLKWSALKGGDTVDKSSESVILVDTTGELMQFYFIASLVFVGKSLCEHGGQNIIEPAALGKPIIIGPNMENFRQVTADFLVAGALTQIGSPEEMKSAILKLLDDRGQAEVMGRRAFSLVEKKRALVRSSAGQVLKFIPSRS